MTPGTGAARRGVSLVEVLVAVLIVGGAVLALYQVFGRGAQVADRAGMAFLAAQLGRESIEEVRSLPPADLERLIAQPELAGTTPANPLATLQALGRTRLAAGAPVFTAPEWRYPELYRRFQVARAITPRAPANAGDAVRHFDVVVKVTWIEAGEVRSGPAATTFRAVVTAGVQ